MILQRHCRARHLWTSGLTPVLGALLLWLIPMAAPPQNMLNFKGADINAVISAVAEVTGKNFIVDPRVKGKVTLISNRPMSEKAIYQVFLSILEVHGYSAVPSGEAIKMMPTPNTAACPPPASGIRAVATSPSPAWCRSNT